MSFFVGKPFSRKRFPHTLSQKLPQKGSFLTALLGELVLSLFVLCIGFVSVCIVGMTRTTGSLGSRKRLGTAETLSAQRVVLCEVGAFRGRDVETRFLWGGGF